MKEFSAPVGGMSCQSCKATVEKKLSKIRGVRDVHASLIHSRVVLHYDEALAKPEDFAKAIESLGYSCALDEESSDEDKEGDPSSKDSKISHHLGDFAVADDHSSSHTELSASSLVIDVDMMRMGHDHGSAASSQKSWKWKIFGLWLNLFFTLVVIVLTLGFPGILSGYIQAILATFIVVGHGHMLKTGWKGIVRGYPNMYSLVFLGVAAGYLYSVGVLVFETLTPGTLPQMLFFDAVSAILSFLSIGDFAQARGTELIKKNLGQIQNDFPAHIIRISGGEEKIVSLQQIRVGDTILIKIGEMIPFDGILLSDRGEVVETLLSGEIAPISKARGEILTSGTYAKNLPLTMQVSRPLEEGFFYKVRTTLVDIERNKTPILQLVDRISYYFVPAVIGLSLLGFIFWGFYAHSWIFALKVAISILVIACPCALGLATPFAIMIFFGTALKGGFLLRNSRALSFAHKLDSCVMDKTGTLTKGKLSVIKWGLAFEEDLNRQIFTMESQSTHPYAHAILSYLEENFSVSLLPIKDFHLEEGLGIAGKVEEVSLTIGNSLFIPLTEEQKAFEEELVKTGKTVLWVSRNGHNEGYISLQDSLRTGVHEWVTFAKKHYKIVEILSGDHPSSVGSVARELGIEHFSGHLSPFAKLHRVQELQEAHRKVLMIGDGMNDSLVLAKADLSLSLGEKTDLGGQSGDIISLSGDLSHFITFLKFSGKTNKIIAQNLFWAFFYNILALPWALGIFVPLGWGFVNPIFAALGMAMSSLIVVANSLRLIRFQG